MAITKIITGIYICSFFSLASSAILSSVFRSKSIWSDGVLRNQMFSVIVPIAISPNGTIFMADHDLNQIYSIPSERIGVNVIAGHPLQNSVIKEGFGEDAGVSIISSLKFDSKGFLLATDITNGVILRISQDGEVRIFSGFTGKGYLDGTIKSAKFSALNGLCVDSSDTIYVSDGNRIRKINSTTGAVSTYAGSDSAGYKNGARDLSLFNLPYDLTFDPTGNLIIVDTNNHAIRKINATGYVSTVAGTGKPGYRDGDIMLATFLYPYYLAIDKAGSIYVSERRNNVIRKISLDDGNVTTVIGDRVPGFFDGLVKDARIFFPLGLCIGNDEKLYIADQGNRAIRIYDPKLKFVTTLARSENTGVSDGYGSNAQFNFPYDLTNDKEGNLYISDRFNSAIRKVTLDGQVSTISGLSGINGYNDGLSYEAVFYYTHGLAFDNKEDLYVLDFNNNKIRIIDKKRAVSTLTLRADQIFSQIVKNPNSITKEDGKDIFYFSDYYGDRIWRLNATDRSIEPWVGDGTKGYVNGFRMETRMDFPRGLCLDPAGNLWFVDYNHVIRRVDRNGQVTTVAGTKGLGYQDGAGINAKFYAPNGVASDKYGNVYVTDTYNYVVRKVDDKGQVSTIAGSPKNFGVRDGVGSSIFFNYPSGVLVHPNGNLYVTDAGQNFIREINVTTGRSKIIAGFGGSSFSKDAEYLDYLKTPQGLAVHPKNEVIYICDTKDNTILKMNKDNKLEIFAGLGSIGWYDSTEGNLRDSQFYYPHGIAFSPDGQAIFVADTFNHVIRRIVGNSVETIAGSGYPGFKNGLLSNSTFNHPKSLVCDNEGNLYVADTFNHAIRKININAKSVSTLVGNGFAGFKDGKGITSQLRSPIDLALAFNDSILFVADTANHAIRQLNITSNILKTISGTGFPDFQDGNNGRAAFKNPSGLAFDSVKNLLYISDTGNDAIRVLDIESQNVSTLYDSIQKPPTSEEYLYKPTGIVIKPSTKELFILEAGKNAIRKIDLYVKPSVPKTDSSDNIVLISALTTGIIIVAVVIAFFAKSMISRTGTKVTKRLDKIGQSYRKGNVQELTETMTMSRTVAISLPGHLLLDKRLNGIKYDSTNIKTGGTAAVIAGKLKDPKMISANGFVDVALKIVNSGENEKEFVMESFRYEIAVMAALPDSPNLIKLIGYCLDPMVIVMKYYGMNLLDCLESNQFFSSLEVKVRALMDVSSGMQLVHAKDIIHFDLKPGNILLDFKSKLDFNFVICDFGFADFASEAKRQLVAGMKKPSVKGITLRYAAPELLQRLSTNEEAHNPKMVDVYAFSMIAFYVWFGIKPWKQETPDQIQEKVLKSERPAFPEKGEKDHENDELIEKLIKACWDQDPLQRLSFEQILNELETLIIK